MAGWTPLTNQPNFTANHMMLLTDGTRAGTGSSYRQLVQTHARRVWQLCKRRLDPTCNRTQWPDLFRLGYPD